MKSALAARRKTSVFKNLLIATGCNDSSIKSVIDIRVFATRVVNCCHRGSCNKSLVSHVATIAVFGLFVVSSGFEELLDRRSQQVDDADERVIVSVSPGPAFGGLEDAVERLDASVAVA